MAYQKLAQALNDSVKMYTPDVLYPRECLIININENDTLKIRVNIGENIYLDEVRYIGIPKIDTTGLFIPLNNNYDEGYCICYNETTESLTENVIINNYDDSLTEELNEVKESEEETSDEISNETSEETQTNINYDRRYAKINHTHTENVGTIEDLKTLIKNTKEGNILSLDKNFKNERYGNIIINKKIIIDGNGHSIENISFTCDTNEIELNNIVFFNVTTNRVNGGVLQLNGQRISINNCIFYNNIINGTSVYEGGAISVNTSSIETKIIDCYFISNFCSNNGGAIRWIANDGVLIGCKFIENTATNSGGAIKWLGTNGLIRDCLFENNKSNNANDILTTDENLMGIGNKFLTESDIVGSEKFYDYITEFDKKEIEDEIHSNFGRNILYDTQEMIVSTPPNNISYSEEFRRNKVVYFDDESSNENGYRDWYYDIATDEFDYNDEFTFSFWVKSDEENIGKVKAYFTGGTGYIKTKVINSNGYNSLDIFNDGHITFDVDDEWKKCFVTWKLDSTGARIYKRVTIRIYDDAKIYLSSPKLERGKVSTDWTPNPNDKLDNCVCFTTENSGINGFAKIMKIKNIKSTTYYNTVIGFDVYQKNKKFPVRCYLKFKNENIQNFNIDSFYYYGENSDIYIINSKDKEWDLYIKKTENNDVIEIKNLTVNDSFTTKNNKLEFYSLNEECLNEELPYDETDTHSAKAVKSNYCLDKEQTDSYYILSENIITKLSTSSTDEEIPSAKAVYDTINQLGVTDLTSYVNNISDYDTNGVSLSVTENNELYVTNSSDNNKPYHTKAFTNNDTYTIQLDIKKPAGTYLGKDFNIIIGETSNKLEISFQFYNVYFTENGEIIGQINAIQILDYKTIRIHKNLNNWIFDYNNGEITHTFQTTNDIPNKISYCGLHTNDKLYVRNVKLYVHTNNIVDMIYPIGSIYMSVNDVNPNILFGSQWERIGQGRTLIGEGIWTDSNNETKTFSNGTTGGEYSHTLTRNEIPNHYHPYTTAPQLYAERDTSASQIISPSTGASKSVKKNTDYQYTEGGTDKPHNNIQPYLVVYMWKRVG